MSEFDSEAFKIKMARRRILKNLEMVFDTGMPVRSLWFTVCDVSDSYDLQLFKFDLKYLKGKGYIAYQDETNEAMKRISQAIHKTDFFDRIVELTIQGKGIAERTSHDPDLDI